jgi:hypothetical protein
LAPEAEPEQAIWFSDTATKNIVETVKKPSWNLSNDEKLQALRNNFSGLAAFHK